MEGFFGGGFLGNDYVNEVIFMNYDKDESKYLEKDEIANMLRKEYGLDPDLVGVQAIDTNDDGKLSFEELNKWMNEGEKLDQVLDQGSSRFAAMKKASDAFQNVDTNKSWDLDREEFTTFYKENDYKEERLDATLDELDPEKKDQILFKTFMEWMGKVDASWFGGKDEEDLFLFNMNDLVNEQVLGKFDKSEDNKLSAEEVKTMLMDDYGLTEEQIDIQSLLLDTDGDGKVSKDEFNKWLKSGAKLDQVSENSRFNKMKKAGELFKQADTNKNGSMDRTEFVSFYRNNKIFPDCDIRQVGGVLKEVDPENNDAISFAAFLAWMNSKDADWFSE